LKLFSRCQDRGIASLSLYLTSTSAGDQQAHALGAVLNQLVFWSGKSDQKDGWFYKEHSELAAEIRGVSEDQIQRLVNKICTRWLPGIIEKAQRQLMVRKRPTIVLTERL
jgi:hypothetical protein